MIKSLYKRKIKDIRYQYGESAVKYFQKHPYCEECDEKRLILLCIHHLEGKKKNKFKTVCHNCHMLEHHPEASDETYEKYLAAESAKAKKSQNKDNEILRMMNKQISIREIIAKAHTCLSRIRRVAKKSGFVIYHRKGYEKINAQ